MVGLCPRPAFVNLATLMPQVVVFVLAVGSQSHPLRQFLGDISTDPDGNKVIGVFSRNSLEGELKYQGTDEIGPQMDTDLSRSRSSRPKA